MKINTELKKKALQPIKGSDIRYVIAPKSRSPESYDSNGMVKIIFWDEQTASRVFWAATAINNFITLGADASNAFAETPAPVAPLYIYVDKQFW